MPRPKARVRTQLCFSIVLTPPSHTQVRARGRNRERRKGKMLALRRKMRTRRRRRRIRDKRLVKSREKLWRRRIRQTLVWRRKMRR